MPALAALHTVTGCAGLEPAALTFSASAQEIARVLALNVPLHPVDAATVLAAWHLDVEPADSASS